MDGEPLTFLNEKMTRNYLQFRKTSVIYTEDREGAASRPEATQRHQFPKAVLTNCRRWGC